MGRFITEVKMYVDGFGLSIRESIVVSGDPTPAYVRFVGVGVVTVEAVVSGNQGIRASKRVEIPLPEAKTLEEAFEMFSKRMPEEGKKIEEEFRREASGPKILIASEFEARSGRKIHG